MDQSLANGSLRAAARFWFFVALVGQWVFAYYVVALYGGAVARGNLAEWNKVIPHAYVPGETTGNVAVGAHVFLAVIVMTAGAIQLVPQIRRRAPAFHRWNGRAYMVFAVVTSVVGLYMSWFLGKGTGRLVGRLATSLDAVLIMVCAAMALRHALARRFDAHRRWALRLFLVVGAVWFLRIGFMFWVFVNRGPVGFDPKTFQGPFVTFISFACYLLPLAVLELYLRAERRGPAVRVAMASGLFGLTVVMGLGIFTATMGLWLPHMRTHRAARAAAVTFKNTAGTIYEAEHAVLSGAEVALKHAGYTGTGYADYDENPGSFVEWTVNAPSAGRYSLQLRYANGSVTQRPLEIRVGPTVVAGNLACNPTGNWTTWSTVKVDAALAAGRNIVRASAVSSRSPNLDCLSLPAAESLQRRR